MLESPFCEKPTHRVSRYRSNWTLKQLQSLPTDGLLAVGGDPSIEPLFSRRFYLGVDPFTGSQSSRWQDIPFPGRGASHTLRHTRGSMETSGGSVDSHA